MLPAGVYRIKNSRSGTYITCDAEDRGLVYGWSSCPDNKYQKWELEPKATGLLIRNVGTGLYMSNSGKNTRLSVTQTPAIWSPKEMDDGAWTIAVQGEDLFLDLDWGRLINGTPIHLYVYEHVVHRSWRFKRDKAQSSGFQEPLVEVRERISLLEELTRCRHELSAARRDLLTTRDKLASLDATVPMFATGVLELQRSLERTTSGVTRLEDSIEQALSAG